MLVIFALARTHRSALGAGRGRRLHRRRLLLHQLDQLRQPRDQRRAHVLQHVRRDRARIGARLRRSPRCSAARSRSSRSARSTPTSRRPKPPTAVPHAIPTTRPSIDRRSRGTDEHRPVRLPAQRRALADEPGAVRASRRRPPHARSPPAPRPATASTPRSSRSMRELGIDLADRTPQLLTRELAEQADLVDHHGLRRPMPRTSPASATSTGTSPTPKAARSTRSAPSATTSPTASSADRRARRTLILASESGCLQDHLDLDRDVEWQLGHPNCGPRVTPDFRTKDLDEQV